MILKITYLYYIHFAYVTLYQMSSYVIYQA